MGLRLYTHGQASGFDRAVLGKVTFTSRPAHDRADFVLAGERLDPLVDLGGYAGLLVRETLEDECIAGLQRRRLPAVHAAGSLDHLQVGDVVALQPSGYVRTLYRQGSQHNALFATDRCNSYCLMCSQPPKKSDDRDRVAEHLRILDLIDPAPRELGITGGEPTLLKEGLIQIVERAKTRLPQTALHILSNGRLFYYGAFARDLAAVGHPDLMIGVPLYSDLDSEHDFIVQASGAFDQTMVGLQNLGRFGVAVEIRVVLHRLTVGRLPALAEYIYRNLPFSNHVALMGLESMGFAVANAEALWIDPVDYSEKLREATRFLVARGLRVSIYNLQLCIVPRELWPFCRQSVSDWKNEFLPECSGCGVRDRCGGFFSSTLARRQASRHIQPIAV